jgi:DNA-directed RNA polymerase subunit M/transcription elongation factor TFIIS
MPSYQCPECDSVLKRSTPIPDGKKIKCPQCEAVFKAKALPEDEKKAPPPVAAAKKGGDDEEEGGNYIFKDEKKEEKKEELYFGSLRDKFAKSNIGPAMFITVTPSNWLLRLGLGSCIAGLAIFIYGVFPLVFCEVLPVRPFIRPRMNIMLFATAVFIFGSIMAAGASKLHELTSMWQAIVGSVMALLIYIPAGILLMLILNDYLGEMYAYLIGGAVCGVALTGVWCIVTIFNPKVRLGFEERLALMK